ncbi:DUF2452 domain-containing protein [Halobacteriovorax sp. HLS]|uniref:DUF2452 domain-containing protein n=1 Tax=Halobacteriovorax sp. HLS TaxID=2234000 RepID=UPI0013E37738|nr:DUF2452 domain-containing protein [Halobacteriovorax sp. HLS]
MSDKKDRLGQEIDIRNVDRERLKLNSADLPGLVEFATSASSALIRPEDEGKIKSRALRAMHQQTANQMDQLMEQMRPLIEQAAKLKKRVEISEKIYTAKMSVDPIIGKTYYLYLQKDDTYILSIISPSEWGQTSPYKEFEAMVVLNADHTWDVI